MLFFFICVKFKIIISIIYKNRFDHAYFIKNIFKVLDFLFYINKYNKIIKSSILKSDKKIIRIKIKNIIISSGLFFYLRFSKKTYT